MSNIAVNAARGEVAVNVGGESYKMVLNLGALAALEAVFGDFIKMVQSFSTSENGDTMTKTMSFLQTIAESNHKDSNMDFVPVASMRLDEAIEACTALIESMPMEKEAGKSQASNRKKTD